MCGGLWIPLIEVTQRPQFTHALWSSLRDVELPHLAGIQAPTVESVSSDLPAEGHWYLPTCSIAWSVSHMAHIGHIPLL